MRSAMGYRQGQRPGEIRTCLHGPQTRHQSGCPLARMGHEIAKRSHRICKKARDPGTGNEGKAYSSDRNMLHISYEGGILEDPWTEPDPSMFLLTADPQTAPDDPEIIEIEYEKGDPVAIDGKRMSPAEILRYLNRSGSTE